MKTSKLFLGCLSAALFFFACSREVPVEHKALTADNPFNVALNDPVAYAKVSADHIEEYVNVSMENALIDLNAIKSEKNPGFDNILRTYDGLQNELIKASNNAFMLYWVSTDSLTRERGLEGYKKVDSLFTQLLSDRGLYDKISSVADSGEYQQLNEIHKRLVDKALQDMEYYGVNLNENDLKAFKSLSAEINDLTTQYSTNMNTEQVFIELSERETDGMPENFKKKFKQEDGSYKIPVSNATSSPVMSNTTSEEVRKSYAFKKSNIGASKNLEILDSLVSKRYQLGKLMGANSYAGYYLKPRMAKSPENVWDFVNNLVSETRPKALDDVEVLKNFRNAYLKTPNDNSPIDSWNLIYLNNQLLKSEYQVDYEKMRDYLPMDACLEGMMELYQELLGFEIKQVNDPSVWHEDVLMYEVYESGKLKGRFYLDLYPRPNKETWFYGVPLTYGRQVGSDYEIPVGMLLGNFTKPTEDMPSLLSFGELNTLFHEFGHIMDQMSYEGEFTMQSDSESDFVEAMSQIFENWIDDYEILSSFAKHYETGEVFPRELFDNKKKAKNVSSGLWAQRSLRLCIYDLNLYDKYDPATPLDTDQLWRDIDKQMDVMPAYMEGTHPQANWIHINTHPVYMYGYKWSEVYAQDMFTVFEENGLRDTETGIRYRKLILAKGSQRETVEAVEEFLGRPSNNKAYIKSLGLE